MMHRIMLLVFLFTQLLSKLSCADIEGPRIKIHQIEGIPKDFKPQTYGFFRLGSKHYKIVNENADWYDAVHLCHTVGAQLISVSDSAMLQDISARLRKNDVFNYWVDLSDHSNLGKETSITTGSAPNFVKWCNKTEQELNEEPNQETTPRCVYIENPNSTTTTTTDPCMRRSSCRSDSLSFVCELDNPKTLTIIVR